jgi:hypothetical protein
VSRLTHPDAGTVVHVEGDLEQQYRASGWVDADQAPEDADTAPAPRKRPSK